MKLDPKALAITVGLIWGGSLLCTAILHEVWPAYGGAFLDLMASIYPGFHPGGYSAAIVGALYGTVDGAVAGAVIGWIYNRALTTRTTTG